METDYASLLPDLSPRGHPRVTLTNIAEVLRRIGAQLRYNTDSERTEISFPGEPFSHAWANYVRILSEVAKFGISVRSIRAYVRVLSLEHQYEPSEPRRYRPDDRLWSFLISQLDWSSERKRWVWMSAAEVLCVAGIEHTKSEATRAGVLIRRMNGWSGRRTMNKRTMLVPPLRSEQP